MPTRGLRNNNPGNLDRTRDVWEGQELPGDDERFCTFTTMAFGCRALIKTLMTYVEKHRLETVRKIISRWAPPVENDTESYIRDVSQRLGVDPDHELDFWGNPQIYLHLARAIAHHENGSAADTISLATWKEGAELAGLKVEV